MPTPRRRRSSVSLDAVKPYKRNGSLHEHLRRLILDGAIPNGASVSQVELAERLGVSRTPLREAMKMLQAEGIVQADHGRRTRVTALDVCVIDTVYGTRVLMERAGVLVMVPLLDRARINELASAVQEMRKHASDPNTELWARAHRRFHRTLIPEAGPGFAPTPSTYFDRAERPPAMFQTGGIRSGFPPHAGHAGILQAWHDDNA